MMKILTKIPRFLMLAALGAATFVFSFLIGGNKNSHIDAHTNMLGVEEAFADAPVINTTCQPTLFNTCGYGGAASCGGAFSASVFDEV